MSLWKRGRRYWADFTVAGRITELAEMGEADHVLESISGHLSRRMLSTTRTSGSTPSAKRSTPWTRGAAQCCQHPATATATATATELKSRRSSSCLKASRHSHVTVCFCRAPCRPVDC